MTFDRSPDLDNANVGNESIAFSGKYPDRVFPVFSFTYGLLFMQLSDINQTQEESLW